MVKMEAFEDSHFMHQAVSVGHTDQTGSIVSLMACIFDLKKKFLRNGTARTGKSYLINCLRLLLGDILRVAAPTGVAAFIISGHTLHSLLSLPTKGEFKDLEGERLHNLQLCELENSQSLGQEVVGRERERELLSIALPYMYVAHIKSTNDILIWLATSFQEFSFTLESR